MVEDAVLEAVQKATRPRQGIVEELRWPSDIHTDCQRFLAITVGYEPVIACEIDV